MNPSLIEMTNYCEQKGYEIIPFGSKEIQVDVFYKGEFLKRGSKKYTIKNWQKESYSKLYEALNNRNES